MSFCANTGVHDIAANSVATISFLVFILFLFLVNNVVCKTFHIKKLLFHIIELLKAQLYYKLKQ